MPQTLLARLTITEQYNQTTRVVTYSDDKVNRWPKMYSNLRPGDNGIFISTTNVLIGTFVSAVPNTSVTFDKVIELSISNDQLLQLDEIYPEYISLVKAVFSPFIHPKEIDISALIDSANNKRFVNYYIVNSRLYVDQNLTSFKINDRFIVVENGKFTEALKYEVSGPTELQNPNGLAVKDLSLLEILKMHKARKDDGNNVKRVENIISTLETKPLYKFTSFFTYHDTITNNRVYGKGLDPESEDAESNSNQSLAMDITSLNAILFGPPGTGKTYHTINAAVQVCDPDFYNKNKEDRSELTARFRELLIKDWKTNQGQIAFCTFHQSFSYEDFVEGIKPAVPASDNTSLIYKIEEGIFKRICRLSQDAKKSNELKKQPLISWNDDALRKAVFYKISIGNAGKDEDVVYNYCIRTNRIAIGFGAGVDYSSLDEEGVNQKGKELGLKDYDLAILNRFINYLKVGNFVILTTQDRYVRAIGKVVGKYEFDPEAPVGFNSTRKVEWLVKNELIPIHEVYDRSLDDRHIYKVSEEEVNKEFFVGTGVQSESTVTPTKNFVLIIDEINRGNVSSIFGELITLIEKDKRAGGSEELEVVLPYSKEIFKVPANVYIIGTMNTADRSIEALDTALRRRFSFKEMPPQPDLLAPQHRIWDLFWKYRETDWNQEPYKNKEDLLFSFIGVSSELQARKKEIWQRMLDEKEPGLHQVQWLADFDYSGLRLDRLLTRINERIEKLIDKDHRIGHSYFLGITSIEELREAFRDKVIPLLQEYFFGDYSKIGLVLGNAFVSQNKDEFKFAPFDGIDDKSYVQDLSAKSVYEIKLKDWSEADFRSIYA